MGALLLNSAVLIEPGQYVMTFLTPDEFATLIRDLHNEGKLRNHIGYQPTVDLVNSMTGLNLEVNRTPATMDGVDEIFFVRLDKRVDPSQKGQEPISVNDCKFGRIGVLYLEQ
jgi:hypothetical protein